MCSKVRCNKCGKATWSGCGQHIESALAGVPKSERCTCADQPSDEKSGLISRIFGRK